MYDVRSMKAEDFIDHDEICASLAYADENKSNAAVIDAILKKAEEMKGLDHRDALVLLSCDIPEKNEEICRLEKRIKQ